MRASQVLLVGFLGLTLLSAEISAASVARELEGVRFEPKLNVEGRDLELRGIGLLRYKVFLNTTGHSRVLRKLNIRRTIYCRSPT